MSLLPSRPDAEPAEDAGPRVIGLDDNAADEVLAALSSGTARSLLAALHDEPAPPSELAERCGTSLQNVQYHLEKLRNAGAIEVVDTAYSAKGREMDVYAPADRPLVVFAGDETDGSTLRTALRRLLGAVGVLALGSLLVQAIAEGIPTGLAPTSDGDGGGAGGGDGAAPPDGGGGGADDVAPDATYQGEESTASATEVADGGDGAAPPATEAPAPDATPTEVETAAEAPTQTVTETVTESARDAATNLSTEVTDAAQTGPDAAAAGLPPGLLFFAGGLFVILVVGAIWYVNQR